MERYDPETSALLEHVPAFLLEVAQERSLPSLWRKLAEHVSKDPRTSRLVALVRIWLIDRGDRCGACALRAQCPNPSRCLHAVVSGGRLAERWISEGVGQGLDRIPWGVGTVGRIAATGQPVEHHQLSSEVADLMSEESVRREQISGFGGVPILFKGEVLGVMIGFSLRPVPEAGPLWLRIFAEQIAGAIANARAFEEIERLKHQLELENAFLHEEVVEAKAFGALVGQGALLRKIVNQIDVVAPTDATVLILGETGTGKELVAHEIHKRSRRAKGPLIRVNCASIPRELFESEFFGHAKGAFTGAVRDRAGRFEAAHTGTLFLDEIAEIPLELQGKLLRALQERQYERVGEEQTRRADVRILAATHRDLRRQVEAGRFREDLYYRLDVFPLQVPPLRERKEDIPLLAAHFVEASSREMGCPRPRLSQGEVAKLLAYDWPGNVRELRNVIERAVILARGGNLAFALPESAATPSTVALPTAGQDRLPAILTEPELLRLERDNLIAALTWTRWKVYGPGGAAELLAVKPTTLLSRMKQMGVRRPTTPPLAGPPEGGQQAGTVSRS